MRVREAEVRAAVLRMLSSGGFDTLIEFPILGRVADVFACGIEDTTIAVECKERDWRRGIQQARTYTLATDRVFVGIPEGRLTAKLTQAAAMIGIGVIAVDNDGRAMVAIEPSAAIVPLPSLRSRTRAHFDERRSLTRDA
jgi:hypothetical protein